MIARYIETAAAGVRLSLLIKTCVLISIVCLTFPICVAQTTRLSATTSPDKKVVIAEERRAEGAKGFYFVDSVTGAKLGSVLSPGERDLVNVNFVSSWNPSGSKVAVLVYYGVRASKIKLFARDHKGHFIPVNLLAPDPLSVYGKSDLKKLSEEHVNASENSLGPWVNDKSIRLVSGIMVDRGDSEFVHLLVTFTAILDGNAKIKDVKLIGPYSDREAEKFLDEWGTKYWREPDTEAE